MPTKTIKSTNTNPTVSVRRRGNKRHQVPSSYRMSHLELPINDPVGLGITWRGQFDAYAGNSTISNSTGFNATVQNAVSSKIILNNGGSDATYTALSLTAVGDIVAAGNITGANQTIYGATVSYKFGSAQTFPGGSQLFIPLTTEGGLSFVTVQMNNGTVPFSVCQAEGVPATSQTLGYLVDSAEVIPACHDTSPINTVIVQRPVNADGRLPMSDDLSRTLSMVPQGVREDKKRVMMYTGNFSDLAMNPVLGEKFRDALLKENRMIAGVYQLGFNPQDLAEDNAYFIATLLQSLPLGSLPMVVVPNAPVAAIFKGIFSFNQTNPLNAEYVINANGLPFNATSVLETMQSLGNDGRMTLSIPSVALTSSTTAALSQFLTKRSVGTIINSLGEGAFELCEAVAGANASTCGRPRPQPSPSVARGANDYGAPIWAPILAIVAILAALLFYRRHKHGSFFGAAAAPAAENAALYTALGAARRRSQSD